MRREDYEEETLATTQANSIQAVQYMDGDGNCVAVVLEAGQAMVGYVFWALSNGEVE